MEKFEETWQKVHNASNQNQKVALENGEKVIFSAGLDFRNCDTLYFSFLDPIFLYQTFFLSPDPDRPKIRIRSGKIKIRIREKNFLKQVLN